MGWIVSPTNSPVDVLTPSAQNTTPYVFGERVFIEVIKVKEVTWVGSTLM